jgi:hypothetical protein
MGMKSVLTALIAALALAACHKHVESLDGTYGIVAQGKVHPVLKVESTGDHYTVEQFEGGKWSQISDPVKPFAKADLEEMTKEKISVPVDGIQSKSFAFVHVPKGWTGGGFTTSTGYFVLMVFGPLELQKM